ncbi:unnamed protein product [Calicophoron daubneyi]|uniref:Glutathione synthetase n=1 Tax=Calicophoron daubneyi TaxID=300641 RepID=A0AAV2TJV0_CALDB
MRENNTIEPLPCTLLPSPVPAKLLRFVENIQADFNLLYHKVSLDHEFIESILKHVIPQDDYTAHLWKIYMNTRSEGVLQGVFLGLTRSDYMLHLDPAKERSNPTLAQRLLHTEQASAFAPDFSGENSWPNLSVRQVELNFIATSFGGLAQRMVLQHRLALSLCGFPPSAGERVPDCSAGDKFADALALAQKIYQERRNELCGETGNGSSHPAVLTIVSEQEKNIYDQRVTLSCLLLRHPNIPILVRSFEQFQENSDRLKIDEKRRLFVDGEEIAVVYYRHGYTPEHFSNDEIWNVKYQLERSLAIKCPCIQYMLVNTKLIQAALTKPENLSRFVHPASASYRNLLSTFAAQYPLSEKFGINSLDEINRVVQKCLANPHLYVLKPQREGGGNNYFGEDVPRMLRSVFDNGVSESYVLMERLYPYVVENYILNTPNSTERKKIVGELGIFGAFIGCGEKIFLNEQAGHLLRSKPVEANEGGVAAGFGCLDSPFLV